mgnify:CR=1 FL=1
MVLELRDNLWDVGSSANAKIQKSPIRSFGKRVVDPESVLSLVPADAPKMCSPCIGSGVVEVAAASLGLMVFAADIFTPLYAFWHLLRTHNDFLVREIRTKYPLAKQEFDRLKAGIAGEESLLTKGAYFFVINRACAPGGSFAEDMMPGHPRFNPSAIEKLTKIDIRNLIVQNKSFDLFLKKNKDSFCYINPPLLMDRERPFSVVNNIHSNFDHLALRECLKTQEYWVLIYNNTSTVRRLYSAYAMLDTRWKSGINDLSTAKDLIILSPFLRKYWGLSAPSIS